MSPRTGFFQRGQVRPIVSNLMVLSLCLSGFWSTVHAAQIEWQGPKGSRQFGAAVKVLPNGNVVVTDPGYSVDGHYEYGAVYLYRPNGELVSKLTGAIHDYVGSGGVFVVGDSNFVVCSPEWRDDPTSLQRVGAATWVDGSLGLNGVISSSNSLTGVSSRGSVCTYGVTTLANGHYVLRDPSSSDGSEEAVGAVLWCDGSKGCRGPVTTNPALKGNRTGDFVGSPFGGADPIFPLPDGGYVVTSPFWSNGEIQRVGAVTQCGGQGQCNGLRVSASNSVVGARTDDFLGGVQFMGTPGVTVLKNGDFVINSVHAKSPSMVRVGAITRIAGSGGVVGAISPSNSLFGEREDDFLDAGVTALEAGNYVINAPNWDNGAIVDAGASVLCTGPAGCVGNLTASSGLVGTSAGTRIGFWPAVALANGDYVVASPHWSSPTALHAGAVTRCDGSTGCHSAITSDNSLVGGTAWDLVGAGSVIALREGGYVVSSPDWDKAGIVDAGAVTHCIAPAGCVGLVTSATALTGTLPGHQVGAGIPSAMALRNGNYVSQSIHWNAEGEPEVGAITWGDGRNGTVGVVSTENSFTGIRSEGTFGGPRLFALSNGDYVVTRRSYSSTPGPILESVSLLRGYGPQTGGVSVLNSIVATLPGASRSLSFDHDAARDVLVVGNSTANTVTLLSVDQLFFNRFD